MKKNLVRVISVVILAVMMTVLFSGCYEMVVVLGDGPLTTNKIKFATVKLYQNKEDDVYKDEYYVSATVYFKGKSGEFTGESPRGLTASQLSSGGYFDVKNEEGNSFTVFVKVTNIKKDSSDRAVSAAATVKYDGYTYTCK